MESKTTNVQKVIIARCDEGEDLYLSLTDLVAEHKVASAHFQVMGALERARVGIFEDGTYIWIEEDDTLEISSCIGNVALKDGKPFVHCHGIFTGLDGLVVAGHVSQGCIVSPTAEIHMTVHKDAVERELDEDIGLWTIKI